MSKSIKDQEHMADVDAAASALRSGAPFQETVDAMLDSVRVRCLMEWKRASKTEEVKS